MPAQRDRLRKQAGNSLKPNVFPHKTAARAPQQAGTFAVPVCWLARTCKHHDRLEENSMSIGTIILIILVIALLGGFSGIGGGPFYGTGYYGGGGLGLIVVILLVLLLLGRL
jgi:hypothetical protein